jgi:hypothetical protein
MCVRMCGPVRPSILPAAAVAMTAAVAARALMAAEEAVAGHQRHDDARFDGNQLDAQH